MPIPGFQLENVFLLREPAEANKIAQLAAGKNVVVIGTSFIGESCGLSLVELKMLLFILMQFLGMEVTAYLSDKVASISCIDITAVPFERVLGKPVGEMLQKVCMSKRYSVVSRLTPPLSLFSRCTKSME